MYDTEDEIKVKRRKLLIIICIVIFLILLLLIFLLTRGSGKKKTSNSNLEMSCALEVVNDATPDSNGVYHQEVEIGFKSIDAISKNYEIVKKSVGIADKSSNKETFTVTKSGDYHIYGFVQDSAGHKGKCSIDFTVSLSQPTCELEVTKGTLGDNSWYRSEVEVGFKDMNTNSTTASVAKYYIVSDPDAEAPSENVDKIRIKDNNSTTVVGHVIDSAGNEGICKLTVMKDSTVPTCTLKVNSGTKNDKGEYTDIPELVIDEVKDDISGVASKGIGISKNYTETSYKVTNEGKTTVVGYVKDKAGNEGTCSAEITRPSSGGGQNPTPQSTPECRVTLSGPTDQNGKYTDNVTATLTYSTTEGATITDFGIGESETYNKLSQIVISQNGTHTVYGIVKDSNGNVKKCPGPTFVVYKGELLASKVQPGEYVNYDAGTWTETRTFSKQEGYPWGYTAGTSRQTGVKCDDTDVSTRNGWMVLGVYNNEVYLIHAGTPECIYHDNYPTTNVLSNIGYEVTKYINSNYAYGATILACNTSGFDCNQTSYNGNSSTSNLFVTGTHYWIGQNGSENTLQSISPKGTKQPFKYKSFGIRPVVILKADVMTTGKSGDIWILK